MLLCHGASCMQANGAERWKDDRLKEREGREKNLISRVVTAIYIKERGAPV